MKTLIESGGDGDGFDGEGDGEGAGAVDRGPSAEVLCLASLFQPTRPRKARPRVIENLNEREVFSNASRRWASF